MALIASTKRQRTITPLYRELRFGHRGIRIFTGVKLDMAILKKMKRTPISLMWWLKILPRIWLLLERASGTIRTEKRIKAMRILQRTWNKPERTLDHQRQRDEMRMTTKNLINLVESDTVRWQGTRRSISTALSVVN